jgi:hypothetical protein
VAETLLGLKSTQVSTFVIGSNRTLDLSVLSVLFIVVIAYRPCDFDRLEKRLAISEDRISRSCQRSSETREDEGCGIIQVVHVRVPVS